MSTEAATCAANSERGPCDRCAKVVPWLSFWGNFGLAVYKLLVGTLGGSSALVADAMHSLADTVGSGGVLIATGVSSRPADAKYPYGRGKAEFISAVYVYTVLAAFSLGVIYAAILQIRSGNADAPHYLTILGAVVSVIYNYLMYRFASCVGLRIHSPAIMADAFENRTDAISSVACIVGIIAALVIHPVCDAITALVVGGLILHNSIEQLREAASGLMDSGLPPAHVADIEARVGRRPEVARVVYVKSRQVGAGYWVDVGIELAAKTTLKKAASVAADIEREIASRTNVSHAEVYSFPAQSDLAPDELPAVT